MASPSRRRVLDPLPFLDMEAVLASGAAESVREQHIRASWRRIVREGVEDLESLSECLPPEARSALRRTHAVTTSKVVSAVPTSAQKGFKLVIALQDGKLVETVAIVHEGVSRSTGTLQGRVTVCVSSQVGCKMGCTFCATGTLGWIGDLSAGEIVEQVWHVERRAPDFGVHWRVTNVTFMGMGEPLNNYGAVLGATRALRELWELSPSRITVSTVGVVSKMRALARDAPGVSLALSLHAATQPTRKRLVPSASAYTLEKLMDAVDYYCALSGRGVMIEYILIPGVNDADDEAAALGALLRGRNVVLNLIPYNETSAGDAQGYTSPTNEQLALVTEASGRAGACTASDDIEDLAGAAPRPPSIVARAIGGLWGALAGAGASGGAGTELREAAAGEEPDGAAADGDAGDDMPISCPPTSPGMATPLTRQLRADGVPDALLPAYRRQAFEYSAADFGFARALCAALRQPDLNALEAAAPRNGSPCMPALQHALLCAGIALPAAERRAGAAGWMASAERAAFLGEYHAFVRRVVLPRLDALDGSGRLVYQAEPTLRISLPGSRAPGGKPRASCEHFHPPGELTFWVPLTHLAPASASRDMHVASEPGVDAPVEPLGLSAGQCASWWGHRLRSGFVGANETGASTVGFDFHVIPWRLYRESRADAKRSKDSLRLGGFYTVADVRAGAVPKPTDGSGTGAAEPNEPAELEGDTDGAPDSPVDAS